MNEMENPMTLLLPFKLNTPQAPFPPANVHSWIIRNMFYSHCEEYGRNRTNDDHVHYVRSCTRRLIAYLNQQKDAFDNILEISMKYRVPYASIAGASGVGKSTEVFGWFQLQSGVGRIFLHNLLGSDSLTISIVALDVRGGRSRHAEDLSTTKAYEIIKDLVQEGNIVVLDGPFPVSFINTIFSLAIRRRLFIVLCVSGQSSFTLTSRLNFSVGVDPINGESMDALNINGFTLDDYDAAQAIIAHRFDDSEAKVRKERYYYAGGSARIYYNVENPRIHILQKIGRFAGIDSTTSQATLNDLISYADGIPSIVSEFATIKLSEKVDRAFIERVISQLPRNPMYQEWVAKLDMLQRIRHCAHTGTTWVVRSIRSTKTANCWQANITSIVDYSDLDGLTAIRPSFEQICQNPDSTYVYIPELWNNWGFDAVLVHFFAASKTQFIPTIRFLQCTLANKHSKSFSRIAKFMKALFPLQPGPDLEYQDPQQAAFLPPRIEYSVMTWKNNFHSHDLSQGRIKYIDRIRIWHPCFCIEENVQKYYFNADCATGTKLDSLFD